MRGGRRGRGGRASFVRDPAHQETPEIYRPRPQWPASVKLEWTSQLLTLHRKPQSREKDRILLPKKHA